MSRDLLDLVRELNTLNDDNLADRVIENSDVQWCLSELQDILEEMPTLTPPNEWVRVRHGRWILEREPDGTPYCFHCSVCDNDFHHIGIMTATDYCPNCGARMDIVGEEFIC